MNELERAAADLIGNAAVGPTPVAVLEARAKARRRQLRRGAALAAVVAVLFVGVVAAVRRPADHDVVDAGAGRGAPRSGDSVVLPPFGDPSPGSGVTWPGTEPTGTSPTPGTVRVFTATTMIPRGTSGDDALAQGFLVASDVPAPFRPDSAIVSVDTLRRKVALFTIAKGTVIVAGMFVDGGGPLASVPIPQVPPPTAPSSPPSTTAEGMDLVWVVVDPIPRGTPAVDAVARFSITEKPIDPSARPSTAIVDVRVLGDKVAGYDLAPGTIVVDGTFVPV